MIERVELLCSHIIAFIKFVGERERERERERELITYINEMLLNAKNLFFYLSSIILFFAIGL